MGAICEAEKEFSTEPSCVRQIVLKKVDQALPEFLDSEVNDGSAGKQEMVLRLMKESRANVIAFRTEGKVRVPAIIRPAAGHEGIRVAAANRRLRTLVSAAKNPMQPRLPSPLAPSYLGAPAVDGYFPILTSVTDGRAKGGGQVPLHP